MLCEDLPNPMFFYQQKIMSYFPWASLLQRHNMALYTGSGMLVQWLVLSKLSKEPSKLHNTAPLTFLLIIFGWSGLQTDYAGTMFKTHSGKEKAAEQASSFASHKKIKANPESRWLGVRDDFEDDCFKVV